MAIPSRTTKKAVAHARGFTVVELLVTLSIVVLVTGIVMLRYSSFNSSVLLSSQAYITAFDIREVQSLAVSVRGNNDEFREEYGLYFDLTNPNQYLLFQDSNFNGVNDPVRYHSGEEVGSPYMIDPRFSIVNICATNDASRTCAADDPDTTGEAIDSNLSNVAISFERPDFDAAFYTASKSGLQSVEIKISTDDLEIIKTVKVYTSGQISIE